MPDSRRFSAGLPPIDVVFAHNLAPFLVITSNVRFIIVKSFFVCKLPFGITTDQADQRLLVRKHSNDFRSSLKLLIEPFYVIGGTVIFPQSGRKAHNRHRHPFRDLCRPQALMISIFLYHTKTRSPFLKVTVEFPPDLV